MTAAKPALAICVVTVCRNPGPAIDATATSIAAQSLRPWWIVIDGASRDDTCARLAALPRPPDDLLSEADAGIADAFNKGLRRAGGRAVLFLNAGDSFVDGGALQRLADAWNRDRFRWICGGIELHDGRGRRLGRRMPDLGAAPRRLLSRGNRIAHPAVLAESTFLLGLGGFDPALRYSMDYDLWAKALAAGQPPQLVDLPISVFVLGGRSSDVAARMREDALVRTRYRLSDGPVQEAWLALGGLARRWAAPLRELPAAHAVNRWLGW